MFSFDSRAILHTSTAAVPCNIYKLLCLKGGCILRWNGAEEYIFRLSAQVCMGDEICWDFVDLITTLKCNLSVFCHIMNAKRLEGVRKLVSLYHQRHSEVCFSPGHPTRK